MGKGKSKGKPFSSTLPRLSSQEDFDGALQETAGKASKTGHLLVLEFTATWCSLCQKIAPFYDALAKDLAGDVDGRRLISCYTVDVDKAQDLTNRFGASALPLFVFLVNGKQVDSLVGAQQTALRKKILKLADPSK